LPRRVLLTSQTPVNQFPSELYNEAIIMNVEPTFFFNASLIFFSLSSGEMPSCLLEVVGGCWVDDDGCGAGSLIKRRIPVRFIIIHPTLPRKICLLLQIDAYNDGANDNDHGDKYSIQKR
jgi:hypothetical protein